ncbi:hypothetical protein B0H13DRAFT_2287011 [Mycena leptocephala]|nr:hypothetical protein B0H13DRAFT_2287011 [Mycena leptocephala]
MSESQGEYITRQKVTAYGAHLDAAPREEVTNPDRGTTISAGGNEEDKQVPYLPNHNLLHSMSGIDMGTSVTDSHDSKFTRVFVNKLPREINNEGLASAFLKYGIAIRSASIRPAWNKPWCVADVVVDATDYVGALDINGRNIFGTTITVEPVRAKQKQPQNRAYGEELRVSVVVTALEWSVLQLFRTLQSQ